MRRDFLTIKDRVEILVFKIKAKMLACRLINLICKGYEIDDLFAVVDKKYSNLRNKDESMYAELIRFIHETIHNDVEELETEE